jgi:hypothetical protein
LNNKLNTSGGTITGNLQTNGTVTIGSNTQRRNFTTFSTIAQINSSNTSIGTNDRTEDTILNFMGDHRPWHRILSSSKVGTGTEYLNIETSWNHPISAIQHSANFTGTQRTLTLLDGSGNTSIPGNLTVNGNLNCSYLLNLIYPVGTIYTGMNVPNFGSWRASGFQGFARRYGVDLGTAENNYRYDNFVTCNGSFICEVGFRIWNISAGSVQYFNLGQMGLLGIREHGYKAYIFNSNESLEVIRTQNFRVRFFNSQSQNNTFDGVPMTVMYDNVEIDTNWGTSGKIGHYIVSFNCLINNVNSLRSVFGTNQNIVGCFRRLASEN